MLSTEDQESKQLEDRRKELRENENRSERESRVTELNKTLKKKGRHERNEQIMLKLYFKVVENQHRDTKKNQRKKICEMKNEENEVQTERNEILKNCTRFLHRIAEFYTQRPAALTKEYQPRLIRSPTDHDIRSQENPERNEK